MWTTMLVWTAAVVLLPSPRAVHGAGVFELRLRSFVNEYGKDSLGKCCSGSTTRTGECSGACKIRFRACLKQYQNTIDTSTSCTYGDVITPVLGENVVNFTSIETVSNIINPLRFPFEFSWPGSFSLIVEAYHDTDNITNNTSEKVLLARLATQMWLGIGPKWIEVEEQNAHSLMAYGFRVICAQNYYGQKCENFCRPRDDRFGHNSCSPTGERICLSGWTGDYCNKPSCLPGCDEQHGHCNRPNECICHTGWKGPFCDQCEMYPGCKHGICHKPWECLCDEGWGGLFCNQDLNYCTNHKPCRNNGTCFNTGQGSYTCSCAPGFTGTDCEKSLLDCHAKPCLNGGACTMERNVNNSSVSDTTAIGKINSARAYRCTCPAGWRGRHCEISTRSCRDSPCSHGATCEDDSLRGYTCLCPPGFTGHECEQQIDECAPNPCSNGGTCTDLVNGFNCSCPSGFTGDRCEINIDDCQGDPCLNGGTCKDLINQFRCLCVPGFVGRLCQDKVDYCQTKPCANGGKCISGTNDYQCICKAGFTGKDCSIFVDECKSGPCQNGGTCRNVVNGFVCECQDGFRGDTCNEEGSGMAIAAAAAAINVPSGASYWSGNLSKHVASAEATNKGLTTEHVVVIATLSTAVPAFVLVAAIAVMCMKRRQKREQAKADEEARLQNERNAVHSSMSKRGVGVISGNTGGIGNGVGLLSNGNGIGSVCTLGAGDAHMIKNTWTANKSVNNASVREDLDSSFQTEDSSCSGYKPEPVLQDGRSRSTKQLNTEAAAHRASHLFQKEKECGLTVGVGVMESKRTSVFAGNPADSCCGEAALLKRPSTLGDGNPGGGGPGTEGGCGVYVIDDHYRHDAALAATLATEV